MSLTESPRGINASTSTGSGSNGPVITEPTWISSTVIVDLFKVGGRCAGYLISVVPQLMRPCSNAVTPNVGVSPVRGRRGCHRLSGAICRGSWHPEIQPLSDAVKRRQWQAHSEIISLGNGGLYTATAPDGLRTAFHISARVQTGNKIEITAPELHVGQDVDVFVVAHPFEAPPRRSVLDFLDSLSSGPRSVPTSDEVEREFQEERDAWDC
jgi:hypothetical protein